MDVHICALKSWTLETRGNQFLIAASGQAGQHKRRGPYRNLKRATTAIARKLEWEFTRRHNCMVRP